RILFCLRCLVYTPSQSNGHKVPFELFNGKPLRRDEIKEVSSSLLYKTLPMRIEKCHTRTANDPPACRGCCIRFDDILELGYLPNSPRALFGNTIYKLLLASNHASKISRP